MRAQEYFIVDKRSNTVLTSVATSGPAPDFAGIPGAENLEVTTHPTLAQLSKFEWDKAS